MTISVVRAAAQPLTPWKNGGGSTRQVAIDPPDATVATGFRWRISIARVGVDGPFSLFPGIDRSLWLLSGAGMELDVDGKVVRLDRRLQRFDFAGETAITARLLDGPTEDLNVMVARGVSWSAEVVHVEPASRRELVLAAGDHVVLVIDGDVRVGDHALQCGDALRRSATNSELFEVCSESAATLLLAHFPGAQAR